jgi:hypothetical protein
MNDTVSAQASAPTASRWRNLDWVAGLCSIPFAVILILQDVIRGNPPRADWTPLHIRSYYADHRIAILTAWLLLAIATVFFFFWLAGLWRSMRAADGGPSLLATFAICGGISGTATTLLGTTFAAAAAHRAGGQDPIDPSLARTLFDLSGPISIGWIGFVVLNLAVMISIWKTGIFNRWIWWGALAVAVLWFVQAWPTPQTAGTGTVAALDYTGIAAILAQLAWIIWIGVILMRRARQPAVVQAEPAAVT